MKKNILRTVTLQNGWQVLLLEVPTGIAQSLNQTMNIYCVDSTGNQVWRVDAPVSRLADDVFVSLTMKNGRLLASRFFGSEFEIEATTGVAKEVGWQK